MRMTKWIIELTCYGLKYQPSVAIKGQALAEFLVEFSYQEPQNSKISQESLD